MRLLIFTLVVGCVGAQFLQVPIHPSGTNRLYFIDVNATKNETIAVSHNVSGTATGTACVRTNDCAPNHECAHNWLYQPHYYCKYIETQKKSYIKFLKKNLFST